MLVGTMQQDDGTTPGLRVLATPTSALVDGRLLLDCGPATPAADHAVSRRPWMAPTW